MKIFVLILFLVLINIDFVESKSGITYGNSEKSMIFVGQDTIPDDIPVIDFKKTAEVSPGFYFLSSYPKEADGNEFGNYNLIIDNNGDIQAFQRIGKNLDVIPTNFMQGKNGMLMHTESTLETSKMFVSDTAMLKKDSISSLRTLRNNPYMIMLANGHYLYIAHEQYYMDLSEKIENGDPNTLVISSDVYELDKNKNIVFYWRALDYIDFKDTYLRINPQSKTKIFNYVKTSNLDLDKDGNILLCNTNLSEITKINRLTGDIIWRLGGINNEFDFIDEYEENAPNYFSYQNDIQRLPNGNITLFDNGYQHPVRYSRAAEYELDEVNRTCKLVWEYRHEPDIFTRFNGSVQRQQNGNTVISWGDAGLNGDVSLTEIDTGKKVLLELSLPYGFRSNRISKSSWAFNSPAGRVSFEILKGNTYNFNKGSQITCTKMKINDLQEIFYPMIFVNKYLYAPLNPEFEESPPPIIHPIRLVVNVRGLISVNVEARFNLSCLGINYIPREWKVYRRDNPGTGVFVQVETSYDEKTGELVINTSDFGEFIFGIPQTETKPKETWLIAPQNNELVNHNDLVNLIWSPHGYFTGCNLQIAEDKDFDKIILDTTKLTSIRFDFYNIESGRTYWWRVSSDNGNTKGDWSEIRQFTPVPAFIDITTPNGGEIWLRDSLKKIIRWDKNISDTVKIELYKDGMLYHVIADSMFSETGGYAWIIPDYIPYDSTYKIRVSSLENPELTSESDYFFSIIDPITSIDNQENQALTFELNQNSPNPFSNNTQFEFQIPFSGYVTLSVYNIIGEKVATILSKELVKGSYNINWNAPNLISGQYYFHLQVGELSLTKTMTVIK
ncbi:MAG: aryl-sulfate sulfotransferase [bacterium]